jgi:hypothetical protein
MKMKVFVWFVLFLISSCGRGDHSESLKGGYTYVDNNSHSRFIENDKGKAVSDIVVSYGNDDEYIYALRQIQNHYTCEVEATDKRERKFFNTNDFEYWVIRISDGNKIGPFNQDQFDNFYRGLNKKQEYPVSTIDNALKNGVGGIPTLDFDCKNAKLIN